MRGGIGYQITEVFNKSGVFTPGRSKHEAKRAAREGGARTWHEIGSRLSIHSYNTAEVYKDVWHRMGRFCKKKTGLRDIEKLTGGHVLEYCLSRVADGIAYDSFETEAAAIGKLQLALNLYAGKFETGMRYDFHDALERARAEARQELRRNKRSRAYNDPEAVIRAIENDGHRLAALIQYEGDARISEATHIKESQLKGMAKDPLTLEEKGLIHLDFTKGGKPRDIMVSIKTYHLLETAIRDGGGLFRVSQHAYVRAVKKACAKAGAAYHGPHGFRWSYVHNRMSEAMRHGCSYEQALLSTAKELGHERPDITLHYCS